MTKLFIVDSPEGLREISQFIKAGSVSSVATVWSVARRKHGGSCAWDGRIMVSFSTSGRNRNAVVFRIRPTGEREKMAALKYTPALAWCYEHLHLQEVRQ